MATELIVSTADLAIMVQDLQTKADDLLEQAGRAEIAELVDYENGTDFLKIVSGITKRLEDKRKSLVDDYGKRIRTINSAFKPVRDTLGTASGQVKGKMVEWHNAEERKKREEQERQRREAEEAAIEAAAKVEEEGDASTADAILNMATEVPEPDAKPDIGRGSLTGATAVATKVWKARVDNMKHVCQAIADGHLPEDFVVIPTAKLNQLARDWHEKSPDAEEIGQYGINVYSETRMSAR